MRKYFIILPILILVYFLSGKDNSSIKIENKRIETDNLIVNMSNYGLENILLSEYLNGVIACEMPALFHDEAIKAGIVAARTFYLYKYESDNDYKPSNGDQCFFSESKRKENWRDNYELYNEKILNNINLTKNEVITYNGSVIKAFYFSMSNGYTEDAVNVFKKSEPYLVSVISDYDKDVKNNLSSKSISVNGFKEKLNVDNDIVINNIVRDSSNRVSEIVINNVNYDGVYFRKLFDLRSTDFEIEFNDQEVIITTRGYGHGVGMSQWGANEMAKMGYKYKDILKYYYKDVEIMYK